MKVWVHNSAAPGGHSDLYYAVIGAARITSLQLGGRMLQSAFTPGSALRAVFEATLHGLPVDALPPTEARLERPDGTVRLISLTRTARGRYEGLINETELTGAYDLSTELAFQAGKGCRTTRLRQLTGVILGRERPCAKDDEQKETEKPRPLPGGKECGR